MYIKDSREKDIDKQTHTHTHTQSDILDLAVTLLSYRSDCTYSAVSTYKCTHTHNTHTYTYTYIHLIYLYIYIHTDSPTFFKLSTNSIFFSVNFKILSE